LNKPEKIVVASNLVLFALSYAWAAWRDYPAHKMGWVPLAMLIAFIFSTINGALGATLTLISWRYKPIGDYGTCMLTICLTLIAIWAGWALLVH
jgi:hypothetical protein